MKSTIELDHRENEPSPHDKRHPEVPESIYRDGCYAHDRDVDHGQLCRRFSISMTTISPAWFQLTSDNDRVYFHDYRRLAELLYPDLFNRITSHLEFGLFSR